MTMPEPTARPTTETTTPTADPAALRDRIRRAVCEAEGFAWDSDLLEPDEYGEVADAVLSVLPEAVGRAAVLREAAEALAALDPASAPLVGYHARGEDIGLLRRMADETQQPETQAHSCSNCEGVDPDTCFANPNRPPEQCPNSEFDGYGLQCQKPAGHNLCTFEEQQPAAGSAEEAQQ